MNDAPSNRLPLEVLDELVTANHILFDLAVLDGFGHVSLRHPERPERFLMSRSMAPGQVCRQDILEFDLHSDLITPGEHRTYLERFIHGEIYAARDDVTAVVHSHSHTLVPFSVATTAKLRAVWHIAGFLGAETPVFEIRDVRGAHTDLLIRDRELGAALARALGPATVVLMRGHGSTVVGASLRQAVFNAYYAEINARIQLQAMALGAVNYLTQGEASAAAATHANAAQISRAWDLWAEQVRRRRGSPQC